MKDLFNSYVKSITTYIMFQIKAKAKELTPELIKKNRAPIFLSMGAPVENPPKYMFDVLKESMDKEGVHTYSTPKGERFFLDAIAKKMKARFDVDLDIKTEVCSLLGSKEGLANFIRILIQPNTNIAEQDVIFVPDPGYASYSQMITVAGGKSYPVPLTPENNYMPNLDEVWDRYIKDGGDPKKVKALIINYPNNPLGATATREYAQHTVEFCKKHHIILMSDSAYSDLYFSEDDKPFSILEFEGAKDVAIEFFSFSKPYAMTGLRAGWACGNKDCIEQLGVIKSTLDNGFYKPLQMACASILCAKEGDDYIKEANDRLKLKQDLFVAGLKKLGWKDFFVPNATFYLWLPIPKRYKTSQEFTDALLEKSGIVAVPGHAYGKYGEGYFRISIVCSEEQIRECISRMEQDGFTFE